MSNYKTAVPAIIITETGIEAPQEGDILSGVIADLQKCFGVALRFYDDAGNFIVYEAQSQLAMTMTAIIMDIAGLVQTVLSGMDPYTASGFMQDALGHIYFMTRRSGTPTTVNAICYGAQGTIIPAQTEVTDLNGNTYFSKQQVTIDESRSVNVIFVAENNGPQECPANSLTQISSFISGWDTITNPEDGIPGTLIESQQNFENRRSASVASNSMGQNASLLGALLALNGVTDAQVRDNPMSSELVINGITLKPNSVYAVVQGGNAQDIGKAILAKKPPGIQTSGTQSVTVTDNNPAYGDNPPTYTFNFDYAQPVEIYFNIVLATNSSIVPQNAQSLISQAILTYFSEPDTRPKLGNTIYATDLIYAIKNSLTWPRILSLTIGTNSIAGESEITLPINKQAVTNQNNVQVTVQ